MIPMAIFAGDAGMLFVYPVVSPMIIWAMVLTGACPTPAPSDKGQRRKNERQILKTPALALEPNRSRALGDPDSTGAPSLALERGATTSQPESFDRKKDGKLCTD